MCTSTDEKPNGAIPLHSPSTCGSLRPMHYRRFGRTDLNMPVFSCGGMRYQQSWQDSRPDPLDAAGQDNLAAVIQRAFELGINLHWYYFRQEHWPAILAARRHDMGVFIISPTDKGGHLHSPPSRLVDLCRPLSPIGFNDLFCLMHDQVHTLSIGAARPSDFDAHLEILPLLSRAREQVAPIDRRLRQALAARHGRDWATHWDKGLPAFGEAPGGVPVYNMLRLYNLATAYDMLGFARDRYNLHGRDDHWVPGNKIDRLDRAALAARLAEHPLADRIPAALDAAHALLDAGPGERLSEASA